MLDAVVGTGLSDPELPGLKNASDPTHMLPLLATTVGLGADEHSSLACSVDVLKHWPGKRCTLRYTLTDRRRVTSPPIMLVGKIYRRSSLAARVHETTLALQALFLDPQDPFSVPASLALLPELGLVLQRHAPGVLLNAAVSPDGDLRPFSYAGRWLARLHTASAVAGLQVKAVEHELGRLEEWAAVVTELPLPERARVNDAYERMVQLGTELTVATPKMTHRDFYPGNVLWDGCNICVIDFDWLALGLPILDVGRFLAQVEKLSYRTTGRGDSLAPAAAGFLDAYVDAGTSANVTTNGLSFALAHTFLNLAADEVRRKGSHDWLLHARLFARRACEEAERAGVGRP